MTLSAEDDPFVVIAGNVATGKSGLARNLAGALGATPLLEDVAKNPYFELFYAEPHRWAFHSQVAFTADSLQRHVGTIGVGPAVQDRTVYETIDVFASMLHRLGHLTSADLGTFAEFRRCAAHLPRQPTLLLYLHAPVPTLLERIAERNRAAERGVTADYLKLLDTSYEHFANEWSLCPVIKVDTGARDLRTPGEFQDLLGEIDL
jgi:deoxyadenosine/deoxycytidine kinase